MDPLPPTPTPTHIHSIVDYVCMGIFTAEYLARLATCPSLPRFFMSLSNAIDLVAIAPFYFELIIKGTSTGGLRRASGAGVGGFFLWKRSHWELNWVERGRWWLRSEGWSAGWGEGVWRRDGGMGMG